MPSNILSILHLSYQLTHTTTMKYSIFFIKDEKIEVERQSDFVNIFTMSKLVKLESKQYVYNNSAT